MRKRSLTLTLAIAIAVPLNPPAIAQPVPAPAAVGACVAQPEICAVAAVGVGAWYVFWRHRPPVLCTWGGCRALQKPLRIDDPEEEMQRMGKNAQTGRTVIANSANHAHSLCSKWAGIRKTAAPQNMGNGRWKCRYY